MGMSEFSKLPPEVKPGDGGHWVDDNGNVRSFADWEGNTNEETEEVGGPMPPYVRQYLASVGINVSQNSGESNPPRDAGGFEKHIRKPRI
jgi:hypothetical protein